MDKILEDNNKMQRVIIVGDLFPVPHNLNFFIDGDIKSLFGERICEMFANADLTICNLEGALSDNPGRCNKIGPVLVAPTNVVTAYKNMGIDCCTLANNHITDGGHQGVIDTMATLDKAGIQHIGAGSNSKDIKRSLVFDLGMVKIGLYNVCELMFNKPSEGKAGAWLYDEYLVCREIADLKGQCDYLVVVYHGGIERFHYPSPEIKKRFHRMVDNGADMVLSQHTHCIGCEEWYKDSYLLYGQGNFLFRNVRPGQTDEAILIEIILKKGKPQILRHRVQCVDNKFVRYDEQQDLAAFEKRSEEVKDDVLVHQYFQRFCFQQLPRCLGACRNHLLIMKVIRRLLPSWYRWYIFKSYSLRNLMFMLMYLRSEQKNEEFIVGMEVLLDDVLNNNKSVNWHDK